MSGPKMALVLVSKKVKKKKNAPRAQTTCLVSFGHVLVDTAHPDLHHTFKIDIT